MPAAQIAQGHRSNKNVPSGTCVYDAGILNTMLMETAGPTAQPCDFMLIPHGGIKGTSKSVYYRILHDDNGITQGSDILRNITYGLSFHYGSATRAPRANGVVQYSVKVANTVLGCLNEVMKSFKLSDCGQYYMSDRQGEPSGLSVVHLPFHAHLAA